MSSFQDTHFNNISWPSLYSPATEVGFTGPAIRPGGYYLSDPDGMFHLLPTSDVSRNWSYPRCLQIHTLLDIDLSPSFQFHRRHLCLFQFPVSTREECRRYDCPSVPGFTLALAPAHTPTSPFPVPVPVSIPLASARRRMAETTPRQRPPVTMDICIARPLHVPRIQPPQRGHRRGRACLCPRWRVSSRGVLHVDVRPSILLFLIFNTMRTLF